MLTDLTAHNQAIHNLNISSTFPFQPQTQQTKLQVTTNTLTAQHK